MIASSLYKLVEPAEDDSQTGNIAVIEIEDIILDSLPVLDQIDKIRKSTEFKAVIVRVNSPGGAVGAAQEIFLALKKLREKIPVIVSMGDLAASGGLYVSMAGHTIVALPGTLTGSMGVLLELTNLSRLMDRIYIDPVTIRSGDLKDAGNPTRPLDPKAKQYFQQLIDRNFEEFRDTVKTERKLTDEVVKTLSDGRVIDGKQAVEWKLVDELGTFEDAVDRAKERGEIKGDVSLAWLSRKPKGLVERVLHESVAPIHQWMKSKTRILEYRFDPHSLR